jgi:ribonuclease D
MLIQNQKDLIALCQKLKNAPFLSVDTEFLRERTYFPKLCLIQVASSFDQAYAIDPLAPDIDLTIFWDLIYTPTITKVFHAARQDMEIFYNLTDTVPQNIFDTQVAAMVCGYGDSVGYTTLVQSICQASIDKTMQMTDWSQRPLKPAQIDYALNDVRYLCTIYDYFHRQLTDKNRQDWVLEEMNLLRNISTYAVDPNETWRRLKFKNRKPKSLCVLRALSAWREVRAQEKDVPRSRILRDEILVDIAAQAPKNIESLAQIRNLPFEYHKGAKAQNLLDVIHRALETPKADWPQLSERSEAPTAKQIALGEVLKMVLKVVCAEADVAPKLVANSSDIENFACYDPESEEENNLPFLKGWRRNLFGEKAILLKHGQLGLFWDGQKLKTILYKG